MSRHTLSVLVENHAGVLSRVTGLFSRRGFNIESLAVGTTENPDVSRITIVVGGDDYVVDQVTKQLNKLIDVIKIRQLESSDSITRELVLLKVQAQSEKRAEVIQIVDIFRANIVDVSKDTLTIEMTGGFNKVKALIDMLDPFGIKELVRTGTIAIQRGSESIKVEE